MNPEIKAKWVAALRSGKYKQAQEVLQGGGGFCCLGVLCEISKLETGFGIQDTLDETHGTEQLGTTVMAWAGLPSGMGALVTIGGRSQHLTCHNDDGRTFLEIADAIEEQL